MLEYARRVHQAAMGARMGTFQIGLVNAGAVSGGAYSAGVLDFLFEALDQWTKAKEAQKAALEAGKPPFAPVPDHDVVIKAAAGTSAGSICNALAAICPWVRLDPVRDLVGPNGAAKSAKDVANWQTNWLYRTWVVDIDLEKLCRTDDIPDGGRAYSVLNGKVLSEAADRLVDDLVDAVQSRPAPARPYIADPLQVYFSVTNTRGVPYLIEMRSSGPAKGHRMETFADVMAYNITNVGSRAAPIPVPVPPAPGLNPDDVPEHWPKAGSLGAPKATVRAQWRAFMESALASAAFPVGLPAREQKQSRRTYLLRRWLIPDDTAGTVVQVRTDTIPPSGTLPDPYRFWTIDGGVINNQPIELGRQALSGFGRSNPSRRFDADRAIILIDPFPTDAVEVPEEGATAQVESKPGAQPTALETLFGLIPLNIANARFKAEELAIAADEDVFNRFMIAPARTGKTGTLQFGEHAIASGGLAGFSGFLHERFRMHDFQLGRRNCQKFLRDSFALDEKNPVFGDWVTRMQTAGNGLAVGQFRSSTNGTPDPDMLQIIPLCGTAVPEVVPFSWPPILPGYDLAGVVRPLFQKRLRYVFGALMTELTALGSDTLGNQAEVGAKPGFLERIWASVKGAPKVMVGAVVTGAVDLFGPGWATTRALDTAMGKIAQFRRDWKL